MKTKSLQMNRVYYKPIIACLLVFIFAVAAYGSTSQIEAADGDSKPSKGISTQKALVVKAILEDQSLPDKKTRIKLLGDIGLGKNAYGNILADKNASSADKIAAMKDLINSNMLNGQLAAKVIAADTKLDPSLRVNMVKNFGSPPPVFPSLFNGKNSDDSILAVIETKSL